MGWFKAVAIVMQEYGVSKVVGWTALAVAVYFLLHIIWMLLGGENEGKVPDKNELKSLVIKDLIGTVIVGVLGLFLLWR